MDDVLYEINFIYSRNELDPDLCGPRVTHPLLPRPVLGATDPPRLLLHGALGRHLVGSCCILFASQRRLPCNLSGMTSDCRQTELCQYVASGIDKPTVFT